MTLTHKKASSAEALTTISNVLLGTFILATLFFGREILVPLALAALLTFMLTPLVTRLQRWLGRVTAVLIVVTMIFLAAGAAGWVLTRNAVDLANKLPDYKENIRTKLRSIQLPSGGPFSKLSKTFEDLKNELPGGPQQPSALMKESAQSAGEKATPVQVVNGGDLRLEFVKSVVAPVLGPLGMAALVLLLLIFMLMQREDLRNRLIRLIGQGRISATTQAMDDAGSRVSKYLLMQLVVNVSFGTLLAVGLYFIGVPNAILWGALAAILRFIPYIGPWIAATFPILLTLAVSPDWRAPLLTFGLFILLELLCSNVLEPWLYGSSTGVTPIALVVAALVWTWLWGPVGLVLATPLTVCLVVMGRHIPRLAFLSVVLSDEEPLTPAEDCYHRLHRIGEHDEMELVDNYLKTNPPAALFDSVLIPVVVAAEIDHRSGLLETEQLEFIEQGLTDILNELELRPEAAPPQATKEDLRICCVPARAFRDQLVGDMLLQLLNQKGFAARNASSKIVSGDLISWLREANADFVCISAAPPTTIIHARYLCAKLRRNFPDLKILVGLWGNPRALEAIKALQESGADQIVTTLGEVVEHVTHHVAARIPTETLGEVEQIAILTHAS